MPREVTPMPWECHACHRDIEEMQTFTIDEQGFIDHVVCPDAEWDVDAIVKEITG